MTTTNDIRAAYLKAIEQAGGIRALGRKWKLSAAFLSDVKLGRRGYGPKILKRLGFAATRHPPVYTYRKEG